MAISLQNLSDEELAEKVRNGFVSAFDTLLTRYEKRVFGFLRQKVVNFSDAEDLTQKSFIAAYQSIHQYNNKYRFSTWLFAIARNMVINHHRKMVRKPEEWSGDDDDIRDEHNTLDKIVAEDDLKHLWKLARKTLTDDQFTVMWLKYAEDMKVKEIAKTIKKSSGHVKVLLHRGRISLSAYVKRNKHLTG